MKVGDLVKIRRPYCTAASIDTGLILIIVRIQFKSEFKVVHITGSAIGTFWYVDEKEIIPLKDTL